MKRTILAILLAAVMLLGLTPFASAAGAAFVVEVPAGPVAAGETFDVTVSLRDNPGFHSLKFNLVYDEGTVDCTKAAKGPLAEQMLSVTNTKGFHGAIVTGASVEEVTGDGVVAVFSFTAKKALTALSFEAYDSDISDIDGKWLKIDVVWVRPDGSEPEPGGTTPQPSPGGEAAAPSFSDISGHWGELYILEAAMRGLLNGYPDGRFGPNDNVTRAQFVTVLYRMAGSPATSAKTPFEDIGNLSEEFQTAIAWAYEKGCVNGKAETVFDPNGDITRQEAMKILFYYAGGKSGEEVMYYKVYDEGYIDSGSIAAWAKPAMYWGRYNKIISGTSENTLSPEGKATRAQMAKILVNYLDTFM